MARLGTSGHFPINKEPTINFTQNRNGAADTQELYDYHNISPCELNYHRNTFMNNLNQNGFTSVTLEPIPTSLSTTRTS